MKLILASILACVAMATAGDAQAQYASPRPLPYASSPGYSLSPPGYHQHDGFYFHTELGIAGASSKATAAGTDLSFSGGGVDFALAFGGAVAPHWIVFGELQVVAVADPTTKVNGREVDTGSRPQSFGVGGIGPGVAYYFDQSNIFLSASLLISTLSVTDAKGDDQSTDGGAGLTLKVGKEWWVSEDWALGLLFGVHASSTKEKKEVTDPTTWHNRAAFLSFSATYN